jgi:hypothetical protein
MVCSTPWGASQLASTYAEGITAYMTAGHGGFRLSAERNARVIPTLRIDSGWYEEDDAWAIVALTFPDLFTGYERKLADRTIRDKWPDEWEAIHGRSLQPGESTGKDRRDFERQHAGDWIVASAISLWPPARDGRGGGRSRCPAGRKCGGAAVSRAGGGISGARPLRLRDR